MPNFALEGPKWSSSSITWSFAAAGGDFSNAITGAYQSTIRAAIARWAQVANITFKEVADSSNVNIRIGWGLFTSTQVGETNYSSITSLSGGQIFRAGTTVRLEDPAGRAVGTAANSTYQGTGTTLYQTILHELGHALGLAHSSDPYAVMYASIGPSDTDLNSSDILGIQTIYGANPAAPVTISNTITTTPTTNVTTITSSNVGTMSPLNAAMSSNVISVYRFFDSKNGTQFLTANLSERNTVIATRPDLAYEGPGLGALSSPVGDANAVPVYRFFDTGNGAHFFTTSASENAQILATRPDFVAEQPSFYEHSTQAAGDVPVYRFFDTKNGTHFFTNSSAEKAQLVATRPDLKLEGVAFYAPTQSAASATAQAAQAAATVEPQIVSGGSSTMVVYRFDSADGQQFLTANPTEGDAALIGNRSFAAAGAAMGAIWPDAADADAAPVFRFFNAATGDHLLTADVNEVAQIAATRPDLVQEQTAFYEHLAPQAGDVAVYRFFNEGNGTHFYTASASEHASILATRPDMTQEGIAFYAPSI